MATSPLRDLGQRLELFVSAVIESANVDKVLPSQALQAADYVDAVLAALPKSFGERFYFDGAMIQALSESFGGSGLVVLPPSIIPRHEGDWGYTTIRVPSVTDRPEPAAEVVFLPGADSLDEVNLLTYPLLLHELGHAILLRYGTEFEERFTAELQTLLGKLKFRALPDRGLNRTRALDSVKRIAHLWEPTRDHRNWAHELAIDICAVWLGGPAYIAAFEDVLLDDALNPYEISQTHPPYALRAAAIAEAGYQLGWSSFIGNIATVNKRWAASKWSKKRSNKYAEAADPALVNACTTEILKRCGELGLPKCTTATIARVELSIDRSEVPDFGLDVLVAAWLMWQRAGKSGYADWEVRTVKSLHALITQ